MTTCIVTLRACALSLDAAFQAIVAECDASCLMGGYVDMSDSDSDSDPDPDKDMHDTHLLQ